MGCKTLGILCSFTALIYFLYKPISTSPILSKTNAINCCTDFNNLTQSDVPITDIKSNSTYFKVKSISPILDTFVDNKTAIKTVIIGIGTGRCGTMSFAKFLDQQPHTMVTHEWNYCRGFRWNEASFSSAKARHKAFLARKGRFVGDVALWNLPYAIYFLRFPTVKVIALKRTKNDTVKSFERWFGRMRHFPWITANQRRLTSFKDNNIYDNCYPKYIFPVREPSIAEGASIYWDDYYTRVDKLKEKYPERISIVDTYGILFNDTIKKDILNWIGMKPPFNLRIPLTHPTRTKAEIKTNSYSYRIGFAMDQTQ